MDSRAALRIAQITISGDQSQELPDDNQREPTEEPSHDHQQAVDIEGLKDRIKATWTAGDYARVARVTEHIADEFILRRQLKPNVRMLDVACGNGNLSIPAAKAGAVVIGIDIAPNLLDDARSRAVREKVNVKFEEGDAEHLPYDTGTFDLVVSMFGAMLAPRPDVVASELCRVCRSGGEIAMANWTPTGFIGELFKVAGKHVARPSAYPVRCYGATRQPFVSGSAVMGPTSGPGDFW